jgi:hypothetical protein
MKPATKMCPHRFCRGAHRGVYASAFLMELTSIYPILQAATLLIGLVFLWAWWTLRSRGIKPRPLPFDKPNPYLVVRRGWARAAVCFDVLFCLALTFTILLNIGDHAGIIPHATLKDGSLIGALIASGVATGIIGGVVLCHYQATRPGKPKKVRVPWGVSFEGV